ncbi:MAG: sensor histidine kinase [Caulobacteraceae bacterium]|nr:sensor histidine kinase [Caulobacteraceae bacterium]
MVLAAAWSLATLVIAGVFLTVRFQNAAQSRLENRVAETIQILAAKTDVASNGRLIAPTLTNPRYSITYSGSYWQVAEVGPTNRLTPVLFDKSLLNTFIPEPTQGVRVLLTQPGQTYFYNAPGPNGKNLRVGALLYKSLTGHPGPVVFMAAEDRTQQDKDVRGFAVTTAIALILVAGGMLAGLFIQVRVGLQPLFDLKREIAEVRKGRADALVEDYPAELEPLAQELNALVAHNREVVERQRTHVGNLAHALKTPISVMLAEAESAPKSKLAEVVRRQATALHEHVDHHLRRARAAARTQGQRERTLLAPVLDELSRTLERIFRDKGVRFDWDCDDELAFQGERQDLQEIIGNVMENAGKWCRSRVRIRAEAVGPGLLSVVVEDDGPGLPAERRAEVLKRGARLDEATPGSGLGLSIVEDLARAYGGSVALGDSGWGGLSVALRLPRAET